MVHDNSLQKAVLSTFCTSHTYYQAFHVCFEVSVDGARGSWAYNNNNMYTMTMQESVILVLINRFVSSH